MTSPRKLSVLLTAAVATLALAGCTDDPNKGYTWGAPIRPGIKSIAVPMWTRGQEVYRREVEMRLTEAIQKRIIGHTPYKLTDKSRADTVLTGSIDEIVQAPLSINPDTGQAWEMEVRIYVTFVWRDLRPGSGGKILVERKGFHASGSYLAQTPFNEDFFQGSEDVINRLATHIVEEMELPMGK